MGRKPTPVIGDTIVERYGLKKEKSDIGTIYVLSNPAMPGLLKIGFTQRSNTKFRVLELSKNTAVPLHFVLEVEHPVENPMQFERLIHARLDQYRLSPDKEFFKVELDTVKKIIRKIVFGTESYSFAIELQHIVSLYMKHPDSFESFDGIDELNKSIDTLLKEIKNDDELAKKLKVQIEAAKRRGSR